MLHYSSSSSKLLCPLIKVLLLPKPPVLECRQGDGGNLSLRSSSDLSWQDDRGVQYVCPCHVGGLLVEPVGTLVLLPNVSVIP